MKKLYFDHAATNPLRPEVLEAMMPYFTEEFGNPLSMYEYGMRAKDAIENAREKVAGLVNSKPAEIIFTASGAEANNFALRGIALARQQEGKHIMVSRMEHHSILNSARFLEKSGFVVTYLPVDRQGFVDPDVVRKAITKETTLISVIHASSEVGTIEPLKEIVAVAKERNITVHTDAVATAGNIPVDVMDLGVDLLSMAAHQFYGPKGAGAVFVRQGTRIVPLIYGGIQESGRRAGTENVPAIVGMGKAAEITRAEIEGRMSYLKPQRDRIINALAGVDNIYLTGDREKRLPGHVSFCVEFIEGEAMLLLLAAKGVLAASGSACSSKALKASPVLLSMGIPSGLAQGSIVFTLGMGNTPEDVDHLIREFPAVIKRLREISPYAQGWGDKEGGGEACTAKE
ncbi:MAG: aminotransferase class V-fold PLP-dependent enzyme [Nitrospiraceae bacterium]|nr:aminotransferase class V-fold PLP-dependent enzyme [Nitrospiraceae bacterium]